MKKSKICIISLVLLCSILLGSILLRGDSAVAAPKKEYFSYNESQMSVTMKKGEAVLSFLEDSAIVYLSLPQFSNYEVGEKIHLEFQLELDGKKDRYDNMHLYTWGQTLIDYGFEKGVPNLVSFDACLFEKNGKKVISLEFGEVLGKDVYLYDFKVNDDVFSTEGLFGGIEMWQFEPNNPDNTMMMGYVFATPEKQLVIFDGGLHEDGRELMKLINQYGREVDGWFLSHLDGDHIYAVTEIIEKYDIVIHNLYYNFTADWTTIPENSKDNVRKLEAAIAAHPEKVLNVHTPGKGDSYTFGSLTVKSLNDPDYETLVNTANNTTVVYKLETPGESLLMLGDLGESGEKFIQDPEFVKEIRDCRVVQMAHHGQNGVSDKFYSLIDDIKVCLYPAPYWLYDVVKDAQGGLEAGHGLGTGPWKTLHTRSLMRSMGVRYSYPADDRVYIK